jgi:hypothetical protein
MNFQSLTKISVKVVKVEMPEFGDMDTSIMARMKELEEENRCVKKLYLEYSSRCCRLHLLKRFSAIVGNPPMTPRWDSCAAQNMVFPGKWACQSRIGKHFHELIGVNSVDSSDNQTASTN